MKIPTFLPNVIPVDMELDPSRLRYRLVGTDVVYKCGFALAGKFVGDAYFGADADRVLAHYQHIAERRDIRFADTPFVEPRGWCVYAERIMMPLPVDDDTVKMVFICALWIDASEN